MTKRIAIVASAATVPIAMGLGSHAAAQPSSSLPSPTPASVSLTVNGKRHAFSLDPRTTLLDLLREHLDLTGTKKGCDQGQCGACTVLIDGRRINACLTFAVMYDGAQITTLAAQEKQMTAMVATLESRSDVFRYAWFTGRVSPDPHFSSLLAAPGRLTKLGQLYLSLPYSRLN